MKFPINQLRFHYTKEWYHGTFIESYESIKDHGIDVEYNITRKLDFGPGFYLTSDKEQAKRFAIGKQRQIFNQNKTPCIMTFRVDPNVLNTFEGKFLCEFDIEFAEFVHNNRTTKKDYPESKHCFDFVYGKVADGRKIIDNTELLSKGKITLENYLEIIRNPRYEHDDQLSIHTSDVRGIIELIDMEQLKGDENGEN